MAIVESAIKAQLDGDVAITALLASATSIWAVLAPPDASQPYLTYEVVDEVARNAMGEEIDPVEAPFVINVFATTYLEIVNISEAVRSSFKRLNGVVGTVTVQDTFFDGRADMYDEDDRDYMRTLRFRMFYED